MTQFSRGKKMQGVKVKFVINVAGALIGIGIALLTIPIYISTIGEERYGILSLVFIMLGYLGFLDFGLCQASTQALAKMHDASANERGSVFVTSLWSNVFLGSLGGMIIYFAGGYILFTTNGLSDTLRAEIQGAMPWIAPILPLSMASGISIGALESRERFLASNVIQILSNMLGQILPLLTALFISPSLTTVIPAILAVRALTAIATLMFVVVSEQLHRFTLFDLRRAKSLFQFGIWVALTNIISPLMGSIGQFVIANIMGPSFVARFAVPMTAAMRLQIFNAALGRTVFPRFSRFDREEASALAVKSSVAIAYLSAMLFAPGLVVVHPFFDFWMGKNFAIDAAPVASVLFIGAWFNGLAFIPEMLLLGQKRPDQLAKLHVAEILPYIGALWFLIHQLGLTGAAVAWTLRAFVDALVLFRLAHLPMRGLLPAVPALVGTIVGLVFGFVIPGWPPVAILAFASALALSIGVFGLFIVPELREIFLNILKILRQKSLAMKELNAKK
jgi:O-antigen/teichoic acid export membrane protein